MSIALITPYRMLMAKFAAFALLCLGAGLAGAQATSTDPLNALKSLPADQQQSLIQSVLGGKNDGTNRKSDQKLDTPETIQRKNDRLNGRDEQSNRTKTLDGRTLRQADEDPELRAGDYVLIDLTPVELVAPDGSLISPTGGAAAPNTPQTPGNAAAAANAASAIPSSNQFKTNPPPPVSDFGRMRLDRTPKTAEQLERTGKIRDEILRGNPYKLNRFGVLEVPGLPSIPLAGLTADEATRRLSADPDLREFAVKLTLLRLDGLDDEGVKPFGYDLFEGAPSTFAPVKDIQVPSDYVVGHGDTLNIQLYGNEPASYTLTVGRDGRINFPKLGPITVSGMSFDRARATIEQRVTEQLIGSRVSVTMGDLRSIRVFVLGEAEKPGSYTVSGLSTMTNALFVSGGVKK